MRAANARRSVTFSVFTPGSQTIAASADSRVDSRHELSGSGREPHNARRLGPSGHCLAGFGQRGWKMPEPRASIVVMHVHMQSTDAREGVWGECPFKVGCQLHC